MPNRFSYQSYGKGPRPVLILHGWGFNTEKSWQKFLKIASSDQDFTWIFLQLPGLDAPPLNQIRDTLGYARYVKSFLDFFAKQHQAIDLILAHSYGCKISCLLMSELNIPIKRVVLLGAAGLPYKLTCLEKIKRALSRYGSFLKGISWLKKLGRRLLSSSDYQAISDPKLQAVFQRVIREDLTSNYQKIQTPSLLIYGTQDTYTPLYMAHQLEALLKNAKLSTIRGANHGLHIHHPQKMYQLATAFYSKN